MTNSRNVLNYKTCRSLRNCGCWERAIYLGGTIYGILQDFISFFILFSFFSSFLSFFFHFFFHSPFLVHTTDSLGLCFTIQGDIFLRSSQWKTEFLPCHFNSFLAPRDAVLLHICVQLSQAVWWDSGCCVRKY